MYLCIYFYATAGFFKHFDILSGRRVTTPCHSFWQRTPKNFRALCVKPNFHISQWDCLWAFYTKQHWIIIFKSYHCIIFTVVIPSFHPKRQVIRAKRTDKLLFTSLLIFRNGLLEIFKKLFLKIKKLINRSSSVLLAPITCLLGGKKIDN